MTRGFVGEEANLEAVAVLQARLGSLGGSGSRQVDGAGQTPECLGGRSNGTWTK